MWVQYAQNRFECGTFAAAIGADNGYNLPPTHRQTDVIHQCIGLIFNGQIANVYKNTVFVAGLIQRKCNVLVAAS